MKKGSQDCTEADSIFEGILFIVRIYSFSCYKPLFVHVGSR